MSAQPPASPCSSAPVVALLQATHDLLRCPICFDTLADAISFPCSHVACRACAEKCVEARRHCPLCNARVTSHRQFIPMANIRSLVELINELVDEVALRHPPPPQPCADATRKAPSTPPPPPPPPPPRPPLQVVEMAGTQRLASPSPAPAEPPAARKGSEEGVSRRLLRRDSSSITPTLPAVEDFSRDASDRSSSSAAASTAAVLLRCRVTASPYANQQRSGCCLLCGLNITDRSSIRQYLTALLASPAAQSDRQELLSLTEDSLTEMLGPLWQLHCTFTAKQRRGGRGGASSTSMTVHQHCLEWVDVFPSCAVKKMRATTDDGAVERGRGVGASARGRGSGMGSQRRRDAPLELHTTLTVGGEEVPPCCSPPQLLAMAGLLSLDDETFERLTEGEAAVHLRDELEQQQQRTCYVCEQSGLRVGLRGCASVTHGRGLCPNFVHLPCAVLAGANTCVVFGLDDVCEASTVEVWCGTCWASELARQKR